jgi:hypothetical protein
MFASRADAKAYLKEGRHPNIGNVRPYECAAGVWHFSSKSKQAVKKARAAGERRRRRLA